MQGCRTLGNAPLGNHRHIASLQENVPLQRSDNGFEAASDLVGGCARRKGDRGADSNGYLAEVGEAATFALHLPDAVEAHRNDRDAKIFCEKADATLERSHAAIFGVVHFTFGKNEHAVAAVNRFAGETEAFAEAGKSRQRKNVEQYDGEPVAELISPAPGEKPIARWTAQVLQCLAAHGCGEVMAESRRQRGKNQSDVEAARDVV